MDELELLKKEWQSREQELPKLTYNDIYKMLLKKSSSIVKWIFYISIAELVFWTALSFFIPESSRRVNDGMGLHDITIVANILNYIIFAVFIYLFWQNSRKIKVTDSVRALMRNILNTRKTVKYFVFYNIGVSALSLLVVNIYFYFERERLYELLQDSEGFATIPMEKFSTVFFLVQFLVGLVLIGLLLLFYRLVYGILMRRLKRNYKELAKMEL
ncbi:MAG: hypothetical protein CMC08_01555 [Flavobacteriaceae bacterium]|nr:hypothetical protein [Flavobacteriaceae bacterium]